MKLSLGKKAVLLLHWLISLVPFALLFSDRCVQLLVDLIAALIGTSYPYIVLIAFAAVYALLSLWALCILLLRKGQRSERGFITMDASDTGRVRIAVSAIEQMVKQAAGSVDGVSEMKIGISSEDDAISINVNVVILGGAHVPTVTLSMQRAIRQFVEMNCGVAVRTVTVSVQAVTTPGEGRKGRKSEASFVPAPVPVPVVTEPELPVDPVQPVVEEVEIPTDSMLSKETVDTGDTLAEANAEENEEVAALPQEDEIIE